MQGIVCLNGRVGYRNIPKTACTSIKHELYRLIKNKDFDSGADSAGTVHNFFDRDEWRQDIDHCDFRFIVIRDPVKRLLSGYSNRVTFHNELSEEKLSSSQPEIISDIPFFNPGIGQFIEFLPQYFKVKPIIHHCKPLVDWVGDEGLSNFTEIYKMDELSRLKMDLSKVTNQDVSFGRHQSGGRKFSISDLNSSQLDKLIDFYREDYQFLKDFFSVDDIWREWKGLPVQNRLESSPKDSLFSKFKARVKFTTPASAPKDVVVSRPFIIWTMRRTGGSNFSRSIFEHSPYGIGAHEPFNKHRKYGYVVNKWREKEDINILKEDVRAILVEKPCFKHCVDILPETLHDVLLEESIKQGYRHVFLYREVATGRLLSLNYSLKAGVWKKDAKKDLDDDFFDSDIPIDDLVGNEKRSRVLLTKLYRKVLDSGNTAVAVSFESLYQSGFGYSSLLLKRVYRKLGLDESFLDRETLRHILKAGGQGTKLEYTRFKNSEAFLSRLSWMPRFSLHHVLRSSISAVAIDGVLAGNGEVKVLPGSTGNFYMLTGFIYVQRSKNFHLRLVSSLGDIEVHTWLDDTPVDLSGKVWSRLFFRTEEFTQLSRARLLLWGRWLGEVSAAEITIGR